MREPLVGPRRPEILARKDRPDNTSPDRASWAPATARPLTAVSLHGAGAGIRTRMSRGTGDFKSSAETGLERDYRHTSYKRRNLTGVHREDVLSLVDDG